MINTEKKVGEGDTFSDCVHHMAVETAASVTRISTSQGHPIWNKSQIPSLVESPLVRCVESFYDKNIPTHGSGANPYHPSAWLTLYFDRFSEENQAIAISLGGKVIGDHRQIGERLISFSMPIDADTPVPVISQWAEDLANQFVMQAPPPGLTLDQASVIIDSLLPDSTDSFTVEEVLNLDPELGYFDYERERFFWNEEHFRRVVAWEEKLEMIETK
jgi:hypothetical protein